MNTSKLARTTLVLDRATHEELDYISRRMGVSRSELVRDVLAEPVAMMAKWTRSLPDQPTPEDAQNSGALMQGDLLQLLGEYLPEAGITLHRGKP